MKNNPQIKRFYDIGLRRFAERGIEGIKIQEHTPNPSQEGS